MLNDFRDNLNETMLKHKGHHMYLVYAPHKPDKIGFRIYSLCDSKNNFLCNFLFHGENFQVD